MRAENANKKFVQYLAGLIPNEAVSALYKEILADARGIVKQARKGEISRLQGKIQVLKERVNKVNDLYFDGELTKADRDEQVQRYKDSIQSLEIRIKALQASEEVHIKEKVEYGVNIVENLTTYFISASAETKIRLLGSIFNEEIQFDGENYRTSNFNSMLGFIYQNSSELQGKTEADSPDISGKSALVARRGIEPLFKV